MLEDDHSPPSDAAEQLLRRALLDDTSSVAVSLKVGGLPLSDAVTVIFHGRRDLGTLQTYVACGSRGAGATVSASELLRVPCDLDLAEAEDRETAERLYLEQATALRDALIGSVSHELRTPLASILGAATALLQAPAVAAEPKLAAVASIARDEAERLNNDIQNLLDATRISAQATRPKADWTDPADVINAAIERKSRRLSMHKLDMVFGHAVLHWRRVRPQERLLSHVERWARE